MSTPPSGPAGPTPDPTSDETAWMPPVDPELQPEPGPAVEPAAEAGADDTMWMPGPGDASTWEPPVEDTGLFAPGAPDAGTDPDATQAFAPPVTGFEPPGAAEAPTVAYGWAGDRVPEPATQRFDDPFPDPAAPVAATRAPYPDDPYDPFAPVAAAPGAYGGHGQDGDDPAGGADGGDGRPGRSRTMWIAGAVAAVVVAVTAGVGAGLLGGDDDPAATGATTPPPAASTTPTPTPSASDTSTPTPTPSTTPPSTRPLQIQISDFDAISAQTWVRNAGAKPKGEPVAAWTYTDENGTNVLLQTYEVTSRYRGGDDPGQGDPGDGEESPSPDGSASPSATPSEDGEGLADAATSRIYLVAAKDGEDPKPLRTMTDDNGGPCDTNFNAEFAPGSVRARDTDGDGVAEVTVGWYSACRGDPGPMSVKLALLSGKKKLILRGEGLPADVDDLQMYRDEFRVPPVTFDAEPSKSSWPKGAYEFAMSVASEIYV